MTSLTYQLSPLTLSATALFGYGGEPRLGFELQTNQFLLSESLPILPNRQSYHLRGKVQAHIIGNGNPEDFAGMDYSGTIGLSVFQAQFGEKLKPVSNINGNITFKGNSLETSSINVMYGNSLVSARGKVKNFKNPEAEIFLSSPAFFFAGSGDQCYTARSGHPYHECPCHGT